MAKLILSLAGEMACGKGTAVKYLVKKYDAGSFRFSTILRDVLDRLCLEQSRENIQKLSTILRKNFSDDLLAGVMAEDVKKDTAEIVVIDGVRRLADIKYLSGLPEFKLVYIETELERRHERIVKRGENTDDAQKTLGDFKKEHVSESELQIGDLKNHADFLIDNNGSPEDLYAQLDKIVNENTR
ncbi:MAG TPA: hypothetical protein DHI91_03295 [Candidatus Portnoybacteria bacterium]|nr:hypothetical protein [Candidatus Portnoybacteria bacterium]